MTLASGEKEARGDVNSSNGTVMPVSSPMIINSRRRLVTRAEKVRFPHKIKGDDKFDHLRSEGVVENLMISEGALINR